MFAFISRFRYRKCFESTGYRSHFISWYHQTFAVAAIFILALTIHPEVTKKLQAELDEVVRPHGGLPTLEDKERLPYFWAVLREAVRWMTPTPMGAISCFTLR